MKALVFAFVVFSIVLRLGEVVLINHLAGMSGHIRNVEQEIAKTRERNEELRQNIASASALLMITQRAYELGYIPQTSVLTMSDRELPVALRSRQ